MSHSLYTRTRSPTNPNPNPDPDPDPKPATSPHHHYNTTSTSTATNCNNNRLKQRRRAGSFPEIYFKGQTKLKRAVVSKMSFNSLSSSPSASPPSEPDLRPPAPDHTSLLSDELLLRIFSKLPASQIFPNSLVCKRWLYLHGKMVQSLKLTDWSFLSSGRIFRRFPNLTDINTVSACIKTARNSGILVTHESLSLHLGTEFSGTGFIEESDVLSSDLVDSGLEKLAKGYPNLRKIAVIGAGEGGLSSLAKECETVQEMELHCCGDFALKGVSGSRNLQVVKLIGCVDWFYRNSVVSDIGLTILAQGCRRLVKLELCGCEGSYDGIKAIGQCCQMLEELTIRDHRMDGGWLAALSYCTNLKTLKLMSCKRIDLSPGPEEHLGCCPALEVLHLQQCQMRDKQGVKALFLVCETVREIVLRNCWGLEDEVLGLASVCRKLRRLSLEGCSLLTTEGLESVILNWTELKSIRVMSCNKIKDSEITPELASLFSVLKELRWRPDSRSLLSSILEGTGMGNKGDRFFNRWKT